MTTPEKMFSLDAVDTRVTQPINQRIAQQGPGIQAREQQITQGITSFSKALSNLATYKKERQIADDISLAQEAAVRNEVMPGGLLPIAQRAFEDTQDIQTSNLAYNEIELFTDGDEVRAIQNNTQYTPVQKNSKINKAIDNLYRTSSSSIRNPETLLQLKGKVDGLKVKSMKDVYNIDKNQRYGISLNALQGKITEGLSSKQFEPEQIFTGNWVNLVSQQLRAGLPWVSQDDSKLAVMKALANNPEMLNHADVITNLMNSEFSKGVTFAALGNAASTDAGKEINKIYTQYLTNVDQHYRDQRIQERLDQDNLNETAQEKGFELMNQLRNPGDFATIPVYGGGEEKVAFADRFSVLRRLMIDETGAELAAYNKFVTVWEKAEGNIKHGIGSSEYSKAQDLIHSFDINSFRKLSAYAEAHFLSDEAVSNLSRQMGEDNTKVKEHINQGKLRTSIITQGLQTVIKDALKPQDGLMKLIMAGLQNDPEEFAKSLKGGKNSDIAKILGKAQLDAPKYILAMRNFAHAKARLDDEIKEEARRAVQAGEDPKFEPIIASWERQTQNYMNTFKENMQVLQQRDENQIAESQELLKKEKARIQKEKEDAKSPEEKAKEREDETRKGIERDFNREVKIQSAKEELEIALKEDEKREEGRKERQAGISGITPEVKKELLESNWLAKGYIPPSILKWGIEAKEMLEQPFDPSSLINHDIKQAKKFWNGVSDNISEGAKKLEALGDLHSIIMSPFNPVKRLQQYIESNKAKHKLLNEGAKLEEVGDQLAKVHDDWTFFGVSVADASQGDENFDPSKPLTMEEVLKKEPEEETLVDKMKRKFNEGTLFNPPSPNDMPQWVQDATQGLLADDEEEKPVEVEEKEPKTFKDGTLVDPPSTPLQELYDSKAGTKKRKKKFGGMAGETGDIAKTDIVQTVKKKYRKDVLAKSKQIASSNDFKANILLLEGHKPDAKLEDKGNETVGAYGINLGTARQLLNDPTISKGTTLSTTQIDTAIRKFRQIAQSQIKELEDTSNGKLKFTSNEKKAIELTLWNIGQYALGSKANTRARKAFLRGDKKTGLHEIYSKAVGFNKSNKKFKEGLHNRRVIEQLISRQGSL